MRLRITLMFLTLSVSTSAQSYSGYMNVSGQGVTPLVSYKANALLRCAAAFSSDPVNYPEGCYLNGWLLRLNQTATAPSAGTGYLFCQGQAYLSCTLTVANPGTVNPPSPAIPPPPPDPYSGSGWQTLGGPNDHPDACDHKAMRVDLPATITAGQVTTVTFSLNNFGGGFCSTGSGGYVDWGDGKRDNFPASPTKADDACAKAGTVRLNPGPYKLTHAYTLVQDFSILAHAQGDFKDNGDPGGHTKGDTGNAGSWRCTAQKRQTIAVAGPVGTTGVRLCRTKKVKGPCPPPSGRP